MTWQECISVGKDLQGNPVPVATLQCIPVVLHNVIVSALIFIGILSVCIMIVSGIRYSMSGGEGKQVDNAKKAITFALIGLLVVLFSFFILNLIGYFTGITCITQGKC